MGIFGKIMTGENPVDTDDDSVENEEYAPVETEIFASDEGYDFAYDFSSRVTHRIHPSMTSVLKQISGFAEIAVHIESLYDKGWNQVNNTLLRRCFAELIEAGLLRSKSDFSEKAKSHAADPDRYQGITSAAWITCDRPDSLISSMESFIANHKKYGHSPVYRVCDDSASIDDSKKLKDRLHEFAKTHDIDVRYAGPEQKKVFRDALVEESKADGVPAEIIDFALFGDRRLGPTHGANRNTVLLSTIGEMLTSTDDDVLCRIAGPLEKKGGIEVAELYSPDIASYHSREEVLSRHSEVECDLTASHEKLLGRNASGILLHEESLGDINANEITPALLRSLEEGRSRIRATVAGVSGDSGMLTPRYIFRARGNTRENLVADKKFFESAFESREIYQSAGRYTLATSSFFPGMHVGLDNREILPPFVPVLRGEDTVFSMMLHYVHGDSLLGLLPHAILHKPVQKRMFVKDEVFDVRPVMCDLMNYNIYWFNMTQTIADPDERLARLGSYFMEIGSLSPRDFEELIRLRWMGWAGFTIKGVESLVQAHDGQPDFWADALRRYIGELSLYFEKGSFAAARDIGGGKMDEAASALCRKIYFDYGSLLKWWPAIIKAASRSREK